MRLEDAEESLQTALSRAPLDRSGCRYAHAWTEDGLFAARELRGWIDFWYARSPEPGQSTGTGMERVNHLPQGLTWVPRSE